MTLERIDETTFQERQGGDYEDFFVGMKINHWPGRTITESDNTWLTLLLMNQHPLHFDKAYGEDTEFGKILVNSSITLALVGGMTVSATSARAIANLGWDTVRLHSPVYVGDTLYARSEITGMRLSKSRPEQGIITVDSEGVKSTGETVITFTRSFLLACRGATEA